nr:uncharacterized protein LOC111511647 [Leptinotarsa decemlineata]
MENKKNVIQTSTSSESKDSSKDKSENSKKYHFYRKPSIKKKAPEVKQTRTSMKRMLQANPLLKYEMEGIPLPGACHLSQKNSQNNLDNAPRRNVEVTASANTKLNIGSKPCTIIKLAGNEPNPNAKHMSLNSERLSSVDFNSTNQILSSTILETNSSQKNEPKQMSQPKTLINPMNKEVIKHPLSKMSKNSSNLKQKVMNQGVRRSKSLVSNGGPKHLRRSLSAQHFDRKNGASKAQIEESDKNVKPAQSLENMRMPDQGTLKHTISPIAEISQEGNLTFKTPSAYKRRSVFRLTPQSSNLSRRSIYHPSNDLPSLEELQKRLNDWLVKRGKSISMFSHLKHFQSPAVITEENKENIEDNYVPNKGSYEDLMIVPSEDLDDGAKNNKPDNQNLEHVAKAALVDLNHLIREGYPVNQCEGWLEVIKKKYSKLQEEPEYWECRASIEQSRGNITSAVECYRTAIVQGAEVQEVDKSLDILLQKFSLLNLSTENLENEKITRERARIVQDARNVFKSSIIKFAVQEKKLRKNDTEPKLVATPVRRSTRLSRSAYTCTPGVKVCSSLRELESPERMNLDFRKNSAFV